MTTALPNGELLQACQLNKYIRLASENAAFNMLMENCQFIFVMSQYNQKGSISQGLF